MESKGPVFFVAQLINVSFPTGFFVGASQFFGILLDPRSEICVGLG